MKRLMFVLFAVTMFGCGDIDMYQYEHVDYVPYQEMELTDECEMSNIPVLIRTKINRNPFSGQRKSSVDFIHIEANDRFMSADRIYPVVISSEVTEGGATLSMIEDISIEIMGEDGAISSIYSTSDFEDEQYTRRDVDEPKDVRGVFKDEFSIILKTTGVVPDEKTEIQTNIWFRLYHCN